MFQPIEQWLRRRFVVLHGEGAAHQADVYRCTTCGGLRTHKQIGAGDVCCAGRLAPTVPTWFEQVRLLVFPWSV